MTWIDEFRPTTLDHFFGHKDHVRLFKTWIERRDVPHLVLYGPWGTGKSSFIEAGLRDLFGKYYHSNVTTKNASQQSVRGISSMDEIIVNELGIMARGDFPFRIMLFEEAEQITTLGQRSLKLAMEKNSRTTRFIFITNYLEGIDEGIRNRSVEMEFGMPSPNEIEELLMYVWNSVSSDDEVIEVKCEACDKKLSCTYMYCPYCGGDAVNTGGTKDKIVEQVKTISRMNVSFRQALKQFETFVRGGNSTLSTGIRDKTSMMVDKMFNSLEKPVSAKKLYMGLMDIYQTIRPSHSSPERDMLSFIFDDAYTKHYRKNPVVVGELSKSIASTDIDLQRSTNNNIHMSSFLWKLSKAFGK